MDTVTGYVDHIIYQNKENGYAVVALVTEGEELVCVGSFHTIETGETLELEGNFVEHPLYGMQLKVEQAQRVQPDDETSMVRYLGSGAIKGVGESLAARIVKKFGRDSFRVIEEEPERLAEIKGISERKAREIAEQMLEKKDVREAYVFLQKYGISNTLAVKIFNRYGMELYGIMKENPYKLAEDIDGIGFKKADEIAAKVGIHTDSDFRVRSGIMYALFQAAGEGHTYLPDGILMKRTAELLMLREEVIALQLSNLAMDKKLVIKKAGEEKRIYASSYYYAELNCARMLHDLNIMVSDTGAEGQKETEELKIKRLLQELEKEQGIILDDLQKRAVLQSVRLSLIHI